MRMTFLIEQLPWLDYGNFFKLDAYPSKKNKKTTLICLSLEPNRSWNFGGRKEREKEQWDGLDKGKRTEEESGYLTG